MNTLYLETKTKIRNLKKLVERLRYLNNWTDDEERINEVLNEIINEVKK